MPEVDKSNLDTSERTKLSRMKAAGIALILLVSISFGFIGGWIGSKSRIDSPHTANEMRQIILNESQLISEIAQEAGPSVVSIRVTAQTASRDVFGFAQPVERESAGTGFIISEDGLVATNRHVIPDNYTAITITLSDGTSLDDVEVVGRTGSGDPLDIAFLRINNKKDKVLRPISLGDSSKVEVGDKVVAIGNALGQFQNTVTSGIISGYGRNVQAADATGVDSLQNLFQTDAAINRGNSGGPLVNLNGEVIGINTAVAGGSAQNIGFAIPINDVKGLIRSVIETGELKRPYIGIRYVSLTDDYAYEYNIPVKRGAYIPPGTGRNPSIMPDSPAEKAGLREKDVITKIDGQAIDNQNTLTSLIGVRAVGNEISLTIVRNGEEMTLHLTLEAMP